MVSTQPEKELRAGCSATDLPWLSGIGHHTRFQLLNRLGLVLCPVVRVCRRERHRPCPWRPNPPIEGGPLRTRPIGTLTCGISTKES
jgi:hypothetical protein